MAISIVINNKEINGTRIFYTIPYTGFNYLEPFKIAIDTKKNSIAFYKNIDVSSEPIKIIDLQDDTAPISKFEIPMSVVSIIVRQVLKCFHNNNFPDDISFAA